MSTAISINSRKWNLVSKRAKLDEVVDTDVFCTYAKCVLSPNEINNKMEEQSHEIEHLNTKYIQNHSHYII